jgi:hypothetical protein
MDKKKWCCHTIWNGQKEVVLKGMDEHNGIIVKILMYIDV